MRILTTLRERIAPVKRTFSLFADVGVPHDVMATIYRYPFRHVVIDNLLPQEVYESLERDFTRILSRGLSEERTREKFNRFDLYDLYSYTPKPTLNTPYGCFFSETYFQMLESALARTFTRDTFATFHHHTPNPADNYIHNDYVYEYFADDPLANGINPWFYQCDKHHPSKEGRPAVRAATSIFYLANDWRQGLGGDTGIFKDKDPASLVRSVAPVNNRLLAFDITPTSFHNYMKCSMPMRNSLAQWYFASERDVLARFGARPGGWEHLYASKSPSHSQEAS